MSRERAAPRLAGEGADSPWRIPWRGWLQILLRTVKEVRDDQVPLLAAGVAFYSFLSLFPGAVAAVMLYGLVADRDQVTAQAARITEALPHTAAVRVTDQLRVITHTSPHSWGLGLVVALAVALWAASSGTSHLIMALNLAYDEDEGRGYLRRKALALVVTLGAVAFAALVVGLLTAAPVLLGRVLPHGGVYWVVQVVRWGLLVVVMGAALVLLYCLAPHRDAPRLRWVVVGAGVATLIWVSATLAFSVYVDHFGRYARTYGALAGVAVLLLWLWLTDFIILLGAEINAEAEHQTARDSTHGPPLPPGRRGAVKADTRPQRSPAEG